MSLRCEQGTVFLAPLCGYPLKVKGVTTFVTPFVYFTVLRHSANRVGLYPSTGVFAAYKQAPMLAFIVDVGIKVTLSIHLNPSAPSVIRLKYHDVHFGIICYKAHHSAFLKYLACVLPVLFEYFKLIVYSKHELFYYVYVSLYTAALFEPFVIYIAIAVLRQYV